MDELVFACESWIPLHRLLLSFDHEGRLDGRRLSEMGCFFLGKFWSHLRIELIKKLVDVEGLVPEELG